MTGPAYLFCPADRPDRVLKAAASADVVIIDLEDSVAPGDREPARRGLTAIAAELDPDRTIVRVNPIGTADLERDLITVRGLGLTRCMVPKAESREALESLRDLRVFALCETPLGILRAAELAAASTCEGLMWGSEDLAAGLGAWGSRDDTGLRSPLASARDAVLLAARANDVIALDTVYPAVADGDGLRRESAAAASSGWDAKACIHPRQLAIVREAFRPPAERLAWADEVLSSAAAAGGVAMVGGSMVDEPVLRAARRVRELAGARQA